ncbi:MAG: HAD family hydrolase, partial [Actinobacteria bacterium]
MGADGAMAGGTPRITRGEWHMHGADEALTALGSDAASGLTADEAARRLEQAGPNALATEDRRPAWRMFLAQFEDFMIWVLMVAVVISAFEGEVAESVAILAILLLNGILGFVQEYRAEKALAALKEMSAPAATVVRDGAEREVAAAELVPGDIVLLEAGDKVPADGRLVEAAALRADEAALTGESKPARKDASHTAERDSALGDRRSMVFASTAIAVGRGRMLVTATGQDTEVGHIADLLASQPEEKTPLQRELQVTGKRIAIGVLGVAAAVFAVMTWRALGSGEPIGSGLAGAALIALSLAVAAIPEGLPAVVTMALSLGVRRMASHNAVVRRLHSVETLGGTTFICSDKTGTITLNRMRVRRLVVGEDAVEVLPDFAMQAEGAEPLADDLRLLLEAAASCNDARFDATGTLVGDPTETALIEVATRLAPDDVRPRRIGEVPFDSERKRMTTVHDTGAGRVAYLKGGADVVLALCTHARLRGETVPLTAELHARLHDLNAALASGGHRTLAVAMRALAADEPSEGEGLEREMTYLGITALLDPPRPEVTAALAECHAAGIEVAMITGDHALTAEAIGSEIGLLEGKRVVTGVDLEAMSDEDLAASVEDIRIYAR